jgi:hypothetical protein
VRLSRNQTTGKAIGTDKRNAASAEKNLENTG